MAKAAAKRPAYDPTIYELRLYDVVPGRLLEEVGRMHEVAIADAPGGKKGGGSIFDRHGVPRPLGAWTTFAGPRQPMFLYIMRWDSLTQRDIAFPAFWADPQWAKRVKETDDGTELVESIDDWLCKPNAAWRAVPGAARPGRIGGVHELRLIQVLSGALPQASQALAECDLPLLRFLGGEVLGAFDVLIGSNIPTIALFLAWPDLATQQRAWARLDVEPRVLQRRDRERAQFNQPLFERVDQFLLNPIPGWGEPAANFGVTP